MALPPRQVRARRGQARTRRALLVRGRRRHAEQNGCEAMSNCAHQPILANSEASWCRLEHPNMSVLTREPVMRAALRLVDFRLAGPGPAQLALPPESMARLRRSPG
eukprot:11674851-Alexandrium_andersonii.AAC.1